MNERIVIEVNEEGGRVDVYLSKATDLSRSRIQTLISQGNVTLNGTVCKKNSVPKTGDIISISVPMEADVEAIAQDIPLDIIYEDDDLCVINKPQGMVVHPAPGNPDGTLVNALLFHLDSLSHSGGDARPGIVHRIDKYTSGLLVVAKNDFTHESLSLQFAKHSAGRSYIALVHGNIKEDEGTVDAPIARSKADRKKMSVSTDGRRAVTHWKVLERYGTLTLLKLSLETGRTHQIRVHMAYIKHPVLGDAVYGSGDGRLGLLGQVLHGYRLEFTHPRTGKLCTFFAPIPDYFRSLLVKNKSDFAWEGELFRDE